MEARGDNLVNEAIKRILLDIVIRGHGDRLIGRWSREAEIQKFLEEVPYMLDRINQLHLACSRTESLDGRHLHHHHHHHHHHHWASQDQGSSISDFISLIGTDMHWLVRTRDTMGLTPLHKAVIHCNRPIVEFILDRYQGELAACVWRSRPQMDSGSHLAAPSSPGSVRLIDAQDKYGRSALHYAAALLSDTKRHGSNPYQGSTSHIYQFLIEKGASLTIRDFRGKTPAYYVRHPNQLRSKSIIHLANKLNANFQANVLSKTLSASSRTAPIRGSLNDNEESADDDDESDSVVRLADFEQLAGETPENNRESMSVSCSDLRFDSDRKPAKEEETQQRRRQLESRKCHESGQANFLGKRSKSTLENIGERDEHLSSMSNACIGLDETAAKTKIKSRPDHHHRGESYLPEINHSDSPPESLVSDQQNSDADVTLKWLVGERCPRQILDQSTKLRIRRCLSEGIVIKITELLIEGHGNFIMCEATTACWNQKCRRYIYHVIPNLLAKLDTLHEYIATNQFLAMKLLLNEEPILVRIRRPYKRGSMNALHLAVQLNRRTMVKFLVGRYPELVNQRDSHGATCLHWAAKSLVIERIYFWLLELFGQQLEHIRDSRGKLAADYRQQAMKTPKAGSHMVDRIGVNTAPEFIRQNQDASNELQMAGNKCTMTDRRKESKKLAPNDVLSAVGTAGLDTLDKSIEICLDDFKQMGEDCGAEKPTSNPFEHMRDDGTNDEYKEGAEFEDIVSEPNEHNSTFDSGDGQSENPDSNVNQSREQLITQSNSIDDELIGQKLKLDKQTVEAENSTQRLLGEMVQVESFDLTSKSGLATPADNYDTVSRGEIVENADMADNHSDATSWSSGLTRPASASKLETIILDSIRGNKFKKLEHLILAGCGQRLIDVFSDHYQKGSSSVISQEMENFFKTHVPSYIETTKKIHQVLHECFAFTSVDSIDLNSAFHKLCNLVSRTSLIMCRDSFGSTPLHVALMRSDKRIVDYWLRRHPEVASAPDHQNRNAVHYAALAFAAYKNHGRLRLTKCSTLETAGRRSLGHWIVDETSSVIYENLCSRFRELFEVKDKQGFTGSDYLGLAASRHEATATTGSGLEKLENCCPEYAQLLANYRYTILQKPQIEQMEAEPQELSMTSNAKSGGQLKTLRRCGSCEAGSLKRGLSKRKTDGASLRSQTADDLFKHLDGELLVPANFVPLEATIVRQVAPKPTVGCNSGFHHMPVSPTNLDTRPTSGNDLRSMRSPTDRSPQHYKQSHHSHYRHKARALLDDLDPNQQPSANPSRHHHHHHHHHRHRHHKARASPNAAYQSVVGGVIVPTIIHNDKMDEIETYDIIYRPPPPPSSNGMASSASSFSSSSSDEDEPVRRKDTIRLGGKKKAGSSRATPRSESCDSDSGSIDVKEEVEYDDRVERLSNEFETRVRREKSELRAKVDQIMNEIKMSAKSDKSSRLLSTSTVTQSNGTAAKMRDEAKALEQDTSGSIVNNVIINHQVPARSGSPVGQSLNSSSGHSSARTASSSASSPSSDATFSCSSSTSHKSGLSSPGSSSTTSSTKRRSNSSTNPQSNGTAKPSQQPSDPKPETPAQRVASPGGAVARKSPLSMGDQVTQMFSKNAYGQTYLHFIASRSQSPSILYKVLAHGSHLIGERDIFYRTARDVAVQFNLPNNVQILDKFIIDLFIEGKTSLLRHLLNQGYSPLIHVSDPDGNDIMLILKLLKLDRMIHFLLQMADFQRWRDELHTFIRHGYSAGVSELIKKHADLVRAKSVHSRTSLHMAVLFDRADMVGELTSMDPNSVHETDNMGRTALHYMYGLSLNNMDEIKKRLMASGASLETRDAKMRTPKYYFIFKREIEDIKRIELELN